MQPHKSPGRIVYLCPNGFLGGAEKFVVDVCSGHHKYGHLDPVILFFSDGPAVSLAKELGITTIVLQNSFRLSRPWSLLKAVKEVRTLFKRFNWNIYHATMAYSQIIGSLATLGLPVKRVWYQHGPVAEKLDIIASFFSVDKILFNSTYTQILHHTAPSFHYPKKGEDIVAPGIEDYSTNDNHVDEIKTTYKKDGLLLMMAGRISPFKQYELVIDAIDCLFRLNTSLKHKVRLIIVGGAGKEEEEVYLEKLKKRVLLYHLEQNIFFVGTKSNIADYYKASDIVVHTPKKPEPFGLVVAEAMNFGKIVLAPCSGGTGDFLIPYKTGVPLDTSAKDLVQSVAYQLLHVVYLSLEDDPLVKRIKEQGRANIRNNFSLKHTVISLERHYQEIL